MFPFSLAFAKIYPLQGMSESIMHESVVAVSVGHRHIFVTPRNCNSIFSFKEGVRVRLSLQNETFVSTRGSSCQPLILLLLFTDGQQMDSIWSFSRGENSSWLSHAVERNWRESRGRTLSLSRGTLTRIAGRACSLTWGIPRHVIQIEKSFLRR